jgi:hypothetical protein
MAINAFVDGAGTIRDLYERRSYLTLSVARSSRLTTSVSLRSEVNQ